MTEMAARRTHPPHWRWLGPCPRPRLGWLTHIDTPTPLLCAECNAAHVTMTHHVTTRYRELAKYIEQRRDELSPESNVLSTAELMGEAKGSKPAKKGFA